MISEERAARYSDLFGPEQLPQPECAHCPICATLRVVRETHPEVLHHLGNAATEFLAAMSVMLDKAETLLAAAHEHPEPPDDDPKIRRIDVG